MEFFACYLLIFWSFASGMSKLQSTFFYYNCYLHIKSEELVTIFKLQAPHNLFIFVTTRNANKLLFFIVVACRGATSSLLFYFYFFANQFQALHPLFFPPHVIDFLVVVSRKLGVLNSPLLFFGFFGYELFVVLFSNFFHWCKNLACFF